jgi:hypothetical protein
MWIKSPSIFSLQSPLTISLPLVSQQPPRASGARTIRSYEAHNLQSATVAIGSAEVTAINRVSPFATIHAATLTYGGDIDIHCCWDGVVQSIEA